MKSTKNIIFIAVCILVVVAQVYYSFTGYRADKQTIAYNKEQIESTQLRINQLEERLKHHEESKAELLRLQKQKAALLDTIPSENVYSKYMSDLFNYIQLMDCIDVSVTRTNKSIIQNNIGAINQGQYDISFTSTYDTSEKFINHINGMYQASNISRYSFDNSIQSGEGNELMKAYFDYHKKDKDSIGTTNFQLTIFYRNDDIVLDEVYQSNQDNIANDAPFKNKEASRQLEASNSADMEATMAQPNDSGTVLPASNSAFSFFVSDMLTSGDTFKLSGPGDTDDRYIGLVSNASVEVTIDVYKDHYGLYMKDAVGQQKETKIEFPITQPTLNIISTTRQISEAMPNIHVNVNNYTDEVLPISMKGSLLENIHIFNSDGQEVTKGETVGNISLT